MKGLHNRRGDRRRPRAYGIPRMDVLDERLREAAPPSPRSPQKSRKSDLLTRFRMVSSPGRSRRAKERRRGSQPGPSTADGRPRRAKGRPCDIPGAGKGLKRTRNRSDLRFLSHVAAFPVSLDSPAHQNCTCARVLSPDSVSDPSIIVEHSPHDHSHPGRTRHTCQCHAHACSPLFSPISRTACATRSVIAKPPPSPSLLRRC